MTSLPDVLGLLPEGISAALGGEPAGQPRQRRRIDFIARHIGYSTALVLTLRKEDPLLTSPVELGNAADAGFDQTDLHRTDITGFSGCNIILIIVSPHECAFGNGLARILKVPFLIQPRMQRQPDPGGIEFFRPANRRP